MSDYSELKRLAEGAVHAGDHWGLRDSFERQLGKLVDPETVLALIADLDEARNGMKHSCAIRLKKQIEQLEKERDQLKAENEALRREREGKVLCDLELFETLRDAANTEADEHRQCMATYRPLRQANLDYVVKKCDDLLAAMGKGERS